MLPGSTELRSQSNYRRGSRLWQLARGQPAQSTTQGTSTSRRNFALACAGSMGQAEKPANLAHPNGVAAPGGMCWHPGTMIPTD